MPLGQISITFLSFLPSIIYSGSLTLQGLELKSEHLNKNDIFFKPPLSVSSECVQELCAGKEALSRENEYS